MTFLHFFKKLKSALKHKFNGLISTGNPKKQSVVAKIYQKFFLPIDKYISIFSAATDAVNI